MNLKNIKYLDKNNYDSVIISNNAITYNCKRDYETFSNKNRFSSSLKTLGDEEKKSEVIKHYLENSRVMSINQIDPHRGKKCITISGTRTLRTYVPIKANDRKAILEKYQNDRLKTIYEEDYDAVHISIIRGSSQCFLFKENKSSEKPSLYIKLCLIGEEILPSEHEFLKKLIPYLMGDNIGRYKKFVESKDNYDICIGDGISGINHDIICGINAEKIVFKVWNNERIIKENELFGQLTIDKYVKNLELKPKK